MTEPSAATLTDAIERLRNLQRMSETGRSWATQVRTDDLTVALDALDAARHVQQQVEALMALVRDVVRKYNTVDEIDFNNDPDFDTAVIALHFWLEDNNAWAAAAERDAST